MVDVRLRRTAKNDLLGIARYTRERWSEEQAEVYIDQLLDVIEQIADYPLSGQEVADIREGYRRRIMDHHFIFYALMLDGTVEIARILHEKVDARRHLDESE